MKLWVIFEDESKRYLSVLLTIVLKVKNVMNARNCGVLTAVNPAYMLFSSTEDIDNISSTIPDKILVNGQMFKSKEASPTHERAVTTNEVCRKGHWPRLTKKKNRRDKEK
ncbi:hypothetical protein M0802_008084 [Mischocyttarus mexicanus]|nr:hypothetical protein M0802_008084 [Mischocyttarus mexicanus]